MLWMFILVYWLYCFVFVVSDRGRDIIIGGEKFDGNGWVGDYLNSVLF